MKNILMIFSLIFGLLLYAQDKYERKLYEKVLPAIFTTTPIQVFVDKDIKELLKDSEKFELMNSCDYATVLLIGKSFYNLDAICEQKPIFSTSYKEFQRNSNSFGAFYWRKGRPQIRFKQSAIDNYNLNIPENLRKYIK